LAFVGFAIVPCLELRGLCFGLVRHQGCDSSAVEPDIRPRGDLQRELVAGNCADRAVDAAHGDDLVALFDPLQQIELRLAAALLRPDQEQPHDRKQDDERNQETQEASSEAAASRSSAAALYEASSPRSIAARAPAVRSRTKRRLCRLSRRRPSNSCWLTR